jgi:transcriptional regulator with XRE-family HTH domain
MPKLDVERLRYEMHSRGLNGKELAARAGLDANTVSRALSGRTISLRSLRRIAAALLSVREIEGVQSILEQPSRHPPTPGSQV